MRRLLRTGRGKKEECLPSEAACKCPCNHFGRGPGFGGAGGAQPQSAPARPRAGTAHDFARGDRSRCLSAAETHTLHNPSPRHHSLSPSPTLRELPGDRPRRPNTPAGGRSGSAPAPARVFAGSGSEQRQTAEGEQYGGRVGGDSGEREKLTLRLPRPLPPAPPASSPPRHPAPRLLPLPPPPCIQGAGRPRGIFLVASFSLHFFSFSSISEHSKRRKDGGGGLSWRGVGEKLRDWQRKAGGRRRGPGAQVEEEGGPGRAGGCVSPVGVCGCSRGGLRCTLVLDSAQARRGGGLRAESRPAPVCSD